MHFKFWRHRRMAHAPPTSISRSTPIISILEAKPRERSPFQFAVFVLTVASVVECLIYSKTLQDAPSPIALEPCCGNRAAVLSLLVRLPTGGESYTPAGQSAGLAVASALVTLGSPRRPSQELTTKEPKKTRKSASQHPDSTCI